MPPRTRKAAAAKPATVEDETPLFEFEGTASDPEDVVLLFRLNGRAYYCPRKPSAGLALEYLEIVATRGEAAATAWFLPKVLGRDAYEALIKHPGLTLVDLARLVAVIQKLVMGDADDPKALQALSGRI